MAPQTKQIKFRTMLHVLPYHNPTMLASRIAEAEILLDGRYEFGVGRGHGWIPPKAGVPLAQVRDLYDESFEVFFKALANESRLKMVGLLVAREHNVQQLARETALTEPTVSHHLQVLKRAGLVTVRPEGVVHWHALVPGALSTMRRALFEPKKSSPHRKDEGKRVLAAFVDERGELKTIPASRAKRLVVLKWLVRKFEEGVRYRERDLNEIIQRHHWDCATLRRELVGHRMMAREKGVYWRLPESAWRADEAVAGLARS